MNEWMNEYIWCNPIYHNNHIILSNWGDITYLQLINVSIKYRSFYCDVGETILEREERETKSLLTHLKIKLIIFKSHFASYFIKKFFWMEEKKRRTNMYF